MPGDELHDDAPRAAGPRHAAPRKPLLTRLHIPAGKAVALAAMPTAVLMAMGLTPQLAVAKPQPESPFQDGPCVALPDQDAAEDTAESPAEEDDEPTQQDGEPPAADGSAQQRPAQPGEATPDAGQRKVGGTRSPTPKPPADSSDAEQPDAEQPEAEQPTAEPSPSESASRNPLDPLGVGDAILDLFGGGDSGADGSTGQPEATATSSTSSAEPESGSSAPKTPAEDSPDPADPVDAVTEAGREAAERVGEAAERAAEEAAEEAADRAAAAEKQAGGPEPSPSATPDGEDDDQRAAEGAGADGKRPFPCVEEKKVAGVDEQTPVVLPNQPWYLQASSLTLRGLKYHGVVNVRMADGRSKQALKFTSESVDIGDLHQLVDGPSGRTYHVQAGAGTTSTIRGGTVTMYTERLDANLFGIIPIVFDPEHPPPLDIPFAYFTDVEITQAGQFGGNLTIPGLHQSIST